MSRGLQEALAGEVAKTAQFAACGNGQGREGGVRGGKVVRFTRCHLVVGGY